MRTSGSDDLRACPTLTLARLVDLQPSITEFSYIPQHACTELDPVYGSSSRSHGNDVPNNVGEFQNVHVSTVKQTPDPKYQASLYCTYTITVGNPPRLPSLVMNNFNVKEDQLMGPSRAKSSNYPCLARQSDGTCGDKALESDIDGIAFTI